jgi:hypothetical protein
MARPRIKMINAKGEICSDFFSLISLISWGNMEIPVKIPARIPM